jgi:hypothetical protein
MVRQYYTKVDAQSPEEAIAALRHQCLEPDLDSYQYIAGEAHKGANFLASPIDE